MKKCGRGRPPSHESGLDEGALILRFAGQVRASMLEMLLPKSS